MAADGVQSDNTRGFKGAVAGLPLSDVIQLKGHNMFTGCIFVEYGEKRGVIYFQDGDIVHAEQGNIEGEKAFYEIIKWPGGKFDIEAKIATERRTIDMRLTHLLLEAHRLMDEDGVAGEAGVEAMEPQSDEGKGRMTVSSLCRRLIAIPGVVHAVMFGNDGKPLEDSSPEAGELAAYGSILVAQSKKLSELFGVGALKSVAIHDKQRQLLQFEVKNLYLTLAVKGDAPLGQIEAELRKNFAAKK
jgi:predicted regulator of Ras-like GTPase activity (Roadblock/LC7/MglB family)